ncbi:hypothetical protein K440DRAFT_643999 [Wilcoxina mikolae CBS 423.85]|nr:hypothetical protein K440DRAFT_643999 [Wilcoxina mikolae CBS 423.85]
MFPYYCTEEIRETVMMMRGYTDRDWAALKKEILDMFRYSDCQPDSLVYTHSHRGRDHAFGGLDQTESLKWFLHTYDHISGVVTERGMMCKYERTEMLLRALPKRLWRKAITKLGMHPIEPKALVMFEFLTPAAALPTTSTAPLAPNTSPAPLSSITPTALTASLITSSASSISPSPMISPTLTTSAPSTVPSTMHMTSIAPIASIPSSTAHTTTDHTMMTHLTPLTPTAPTISLATAMSPPAPSPPAPALAKHGPQAHRHRFVNLHHCADLHADVEKGLISINDKGRLMFGHTCSEIPMEPAIRDYCTMRDCARAEAWLLLPPSPPSPPPARSVLSLSPPPPPPPPVQSSRIPTPLVSPGQLIQLVREVVEHFTASPRTNRPPTPSYTKSTKA